MSRSQYVAMIYFPRSRSQPQLRYVNIGFDHQSNLPRVVSAGAVTRRANNLAGQLPTLAIDGADRRMAILLHKS